MAACARLFVFVLALLLAAHLAASAPAPSPAPSQSGSYAPPPAPPSSPTSSPPDTNIPGIDISNSSGGGTAGVTTGVMAVGLTVAMMLVHQSY
jgi:hypothetical protein